mmetsp:Transcript_2804/g.4721  ORF Transcript_2804/g.4721 Transcript_2804/m.4721 type:complete len:223 (+) Transcript_2804:540-1208(+)
MSFSIREASGWLPSRSDNEVGIMLRNACSGCPTLPYHFKKRSSSMVQRARFTVPSSRPPWTSACSFTMLSSATSSALPSCCFKTILLIMVRTEFSIRFFISCASVWSLRCNRAGSSILRPDSLATCASMAPRTECSSACTVFSGDCIWSSEMVEVCGTATPRASRASYTMATTKNIAYEVSCLKLVMMGRFSSQIWNICVCPVMRMARSTLSRITLMAICST